MSVIFNCSSLLITGTVALAGPGVCQSDESSQPACPWDPWCLHPECWNSRQASHLPGFYHVGTGGLNSGLPACIQTLYPLSHCSSLWNRTCFYFN